MRNKGRQERGREGSRGEGGREGGSQVPAQIYVSGDCLQYHPDEE